MTLGDRICKVRKSLSPKMSQEKFAASLGLTRAQIKTYELGTVIPSAAILKLICQTYNINPQWLETGEGDSLYEPYRSDRGKEVREIMEGESPFAIAVMSSLAAMPKEWWAAWSKQLQEELKKTESEERH